MVHNSPTSCQEGPSDPLEDWIHNPRGIKEQAMIQECYVALHWMLKTLTRRLLSDEFFALTEFEKNLDLDKDQRRLNKLMARKMVIMENYLDANKNRLSVTPRTSIETPIIIDFDASAPGY